MASDTKSPYASPAIDPNAPAPRSRWGTVPAIISFAIGGMSLGVGMLAVSILTFALVTNWKAEVTPGQMSAASGMYLGFGTFWILAGLCYWKGRYYLGLVATGIGAMIPGVMFTVLGV